MFTQTSTKLFLVAFAGFIAIASVNVHAEEDSTQHLQIRVPESRLKLDESVPAKNNKDASLDLGTSTWMPAQLNFPSLIPTTASFTKALPAFYANYNSPIGSKGFSEKLGLNWIELNRTANLNNGSSSFEQSQNVHLISARVGAEYSVLAWSSKNFTPYASVSLLPTVALTDASSLDQGSSYFGVPVEASIGSTIQPRALGLPWSGVAFDLGVLATLGKINGSSANAWGANLGVRVML